MHASCVRIGEEHLPRRDRESSAGSRPETDDRRRRNRQGRRVRSGHAAPACNSDALTCDRPVQTELPGPYSPNLIILSSSSKLIPRTTFPEPHSPNHVSQSYFPSHIPEPHFPSTSPELHSPNHERTISRQNAEAEAAEQNPVPHFPPASSDPQPPPDSQCAIIHPANGRRKPLRMDFKLRREGTSGTVQ